MTSAHLLTVLAIQATTAGTLSDNILNEVINTGVMDSGDNYQILTDSSPLSEGVLNTLVNKEGLMTSLNYKDVLLENSPPITASNLPTSILTQICAGSPTSLDATDRQTVLDANSHTCP